MGSAPARDDHERPAFRAKHLAKPSLDDAAVQFQLVGNPAVARDNVLAAAAYLAWLKQRYGFPGLFAAYNFGPGNWEGHLRRKRALPAETRHADIQSFLDHRNLLGALAGQLFGCGLLFFFLCGRFGQQLFGRLTDVFFVRKAFGRFLRITHFL